MKNKFKAIQLLNNLNKIKRTGPNLFAGIPDYMTESIAEHSYKVLYLCLIFSIRLKSINLCNLFVYIITHEWSETLTGDIPTSSKSYQSYFNTDIRKIFKDAGSRIRTEVLRDLGLKVNKLSLEEEKLFEFCEISSRILELIDHKQLGCKHKWIDKMYFMQINYLKEIKFNFTDEVVKELNNLYKRGYMDNEYLTKIADRLMKENKS